MSNHTQQRTINGVCPNCGLSQKSVALEGSSHFSGITTPNWSCMLWIGWCSKCRACLETYFDDGQEIEALEWTVVDEEKLEFLFGDLSSIPTHPETDLP
jgi:hypothetical protein